MKKINDEKERKDHEDEILDIERQFEILNFGRDADTEGESDANPLRNSGDRAVELGQCESIQPWLVNADDDSLSDAINTQDSRRTRTSSKSSSLWSFEDQRSRRQHS